MKIALARYTCDSCGGSFEAPMLGDESYGEFLLWSAGGSVAHVNAFEDEVYTEVKEMLEKLPNFVADPFAISDVLQNVFGPMACDPDPAGAPFKIGQPPCPICGGQVSSWEFIYPPKIVEYDIQSVTHLKWRALSDMDKSSLIKRFINGDN